MIPLELQDELLIRMENEFREYRLKNFEGDLVQLNIYTQHLPKKEKHKGTDITDQRFPYILIRLADGSEANDSDPQNVKVLFIVGVVDRDSSNQGYRDAVNIVQRIYQNLKSNPIVKNRFELSYPIDWAYHDEDVDPFYFAGLETNWSVPKINRSDVEAMI